MAEDTYGVVIYQEQVLRILREIGEMTWEDANELRRAMSKSKGVEYFNRFKDQFITGATNKDATLSVAMANEIWDNICTFGSWAFNKSHAISYGLIGYWCCYLKAHYPAEFYTCALQREGDPDIAKKLLREWVESGGRFVPLDVTVSVVNFSLVEGVIYGGFRNVKGIGVKTAEKIVGSRPWANSREFRRGAGKKVLGLLKRLGALPEGLRWGGTAGQLALFDGLETDLDDFNDVGVPDIEVRELLPWNELWPIGDEWETWAKDNKVSVTQIDHMTERTKDVTLLVRIVRFNLRSIHETSVTERLKRKNGRMPHPHLEKFLDMVVEDDTDVIFVSVNRYKYQRLGAPLFKHGADSIALITGRKIPGYRKVMIDEVRILRSANKEVDGENEVAKK